MPRQLHSIEEAVQLPDPRTSHQLFQSGLAAAVGGLFLLVYRSESNDAVILTAGAIMFILGAYPALQWARKSEPHFPSFEMFMLTTIPFYSVPLLSGRRIDGFDFTLDATLRAVVAMVVFQLSAIAAFAMTKGKRAKAPALITTLLPQAAIRYSQTGIWLSTIYFYVLGFTGLIPQELTTPIRAVFFGIGTVSLFIATRRWGARQLSQAEKAVIVLNVTVQLIFLFRDLYLITGISIILLGLIGYVSTSRRIPFLVLGILLPIAAVLHSGKSTMRNYYWVEKNPAPTLTELPTFFQTWFETGLNPPEQKEGDGQTSLAGRLFERASLFQMLCLVTERTPALDPYLAGESYIYIPAQIIPSFLWPDKPSSLLSNVLLAVHYHLVAADSPTSVSIAFGMIAEAYANFDLVGCAALGALLGFGYKRISLAALGCPQFSALGLLTILLAAWSFQAEQIFATWFVSLLQAGVVVIGLPMVYRILFRQE